MVTENERDPASQGELRTYEITILSDMPQDQLIEMIRGIAEFDTIKIVQIDPYNNAILYRE